jgi:hypothetical protein
MPGEFRSMWSGGGATTPRLTLDHVFPPGVEPGYGVKPVPICGGPVNIGAPECVIPSNINGSDTTLDRPVEDLCMPNRVVDEALENSGEVLRLWLEGRLVWSIVETPSEDSRVSVSKGKDLSAAISEGGELELAAYCGEVYGSGVCVYGELAMADGGNVIA